MGLGSSQCNVYACGLVGQYLGAALKSFLVWLFFAMALIFVAKTDVRSQESPPAWAYPVNPPDFKPSPDDGIPRHVPDSTASMTLTQVRDRFYTADWHPDDHGPMPDVVARGRKPDVSACGFCHRADGPGGPESANLMGLPVAYFVRQMAEIKSGARKSSVPNRAPIQLLNTLAAAITDDEVQASARYYSTLKPRATIKVVESEMAPKTVVTAWFLTLVSSGETEPLGERIIEVATNLLQFVNKDSRTLFIAYVPKGSIEKGRAQAASGDASVQCGTCHGPDLKGIGDIPGIAGRSPTYIFRQLYDFKHGARAGAESSLMKPPLEKLSIPDMIALAAYVASLAP